MQTILTNQNSILEETEQMEAGEYFLSFSAEYFVFQFDIEKYKDQDMQNYNSACRFLWVCNFLPQIEG
jgi:hypothetical protein